MIESTGISRQTFLGRSRLFLLGLLGASATAEAAAPAAAPASSEPLYVQQFAAFQDKTAAQTLRELADREELRELTARYAHRIAHGVSCADLFTDDGAFITHTPGKPVNDRRGRETLDRVYGEIAKNPGRTLPMIHNYIFAISGDEATGTCSNEVRTDANGQSIVASGYYDDTFRRVNGRWKFVMRRATFYHWVPLNEGWAKPTKAN